MTEQKLGRVLVLDDEVELANALCASLMAQGYEAAAFTSGGDALRALGSQNFELLLTDLVMPEMGGIEVVTAALEIDPHLACILMTGQGTVKTAVEAMKIGALDYVLKPFKLHTLLPVLARATEVRRLRMENVQLRETLAVFELGQTIAYSLDLETLVHKAADAALKQLDADEVSLMLPTDEGDELYVAAVRGQGREKILGARIPFDKGIAGWVARRHEHVLLEGEVKDSRFAPLHPRPEIACAVSMPMLAGGKLIGVLNVNATRRRAFTMGQVKGLSILASTAAAALQGAMLHTHLQSAEERYRSIFENAAEGIFQTTEDGHFILANPSLARIYGYDSPAELIENMTDIASQLYVDPKQRAEFKRQLDEQGSVTGFEAKFRRKDGEIVWVSVNALKRCNGSQGPAYYEGTVEDITNRKQGEEALFQSNRELHETAQRLEQSKSMLQLVVESIPVRVFWKDKDLRYLGCNTLFARDAGLSRAEQLLGLDDFAMGWKEQAELYRADDREVMESGIPKLNIIEPQTTPAGDEIWLSTSKVPLHMPNGEVFGVLGLYEDITERKKNEQKLLESEANYRRLSQEFHTLLETIPDGLVLISPDYKIVWANQIMARNFNMEVSEIVGGECFKKFHGAELPCPVCGIRECLATGLPNTREFISWDLATVEVRCSPVLNELGEVLNFVEVVRDVTELRKTEEQLRQAQKMEAIGTLAGGIAHDFNNILGIILGYTELALLDSSPGTEIHDGLEEVRKAGLRARDLVQQILAFSRKQEQERAPLHLRPLFKEVLKLLRAALPSTIEIRQQIDLAADDGDIISADATQIHQVLMNLCTNAGHAMREKGGVLDVSLSNVEFSADGPDRPEELAPGAYVQISVSDTGCGMDDKVIARIFEPYFTTKGVGEGTGLGLSVVHGIVQSHEGAVTVVSEPGAGTTFQVFFPAGAKEVEIKPGGDSEGVPMGKERILLVDDEKVLVELGKYALERYGYTVISATSSADALQAFRADPDMVDLVITDQTMPQMTGMDLAAEMKRIRPGIPVILCTGFSELVTEENLRAAGIQEVMMKPLVMRDLGRVIRGLLDREGRK